MRAIPFALVLAVACVGVPGQTYVPPDVTSGFTIDVLTSALNQPVGLAFLPDGRVLVAEQKTGAIKLWNGGAAAHLVGVVPDVNANAWENGLLAIEADPGWPLRPYVYAWHNSSASPHMRLAMFTVTGDLTNPSSSNLALGARYDILTDVPDNASIHNGGSLHFGPDGMLYVSSGDDANPCAAQDVDSLLGCVLRLDVSALPGAGSGPPPKSLLIPPGNPFQGPTDNARLVWCHGLRNPFRFHIDRVTGTLHVADVGSWLVEEVNESTAGGENFGWPWYEGNQLGLFCTGVAPQTVHPVATVPHYAPVAAIMSMGRYRNAQNGAANFGMAYEGDYFYLDFYGGGVQRLKSTGSGWAPAPPAVGQPNSTNWAVGFQTVADAGVGPDGAIYFVRQYYSHAWGALGRVRGNPSGATLTVVSGDQQPGNAGRPLSKPLVVRLADPSGTPIAGANVTFTAFAGGGSVNPAIVATDAQGLASTSYTLASSYSQPPRVLASGPGSAYAEFNILWRGITVADAGSLLGYVSAEVRHSETSSPFTIAWEAPPTVPYAATTWGPVWTSVISPLPGIGFADGLGLFGPPDPQFRTQADVPQYTLTVSNLPPMGGVTLVVQAYAIDSQLYPAHEAIMISNPELVTIP